MTALVSKLQFDILLLIKVSQKISLFQSTKHLNVAFVCGWIQFWSRPYALKFGDEAEWKEGYDGSSLKREKKCPTLRLSFVIHGPSPRGAGLVSVWYSEYEGVSVGVCLYAERIETFWQRIQFNSWLFSSWMTVRSVYVCVWPWLCVCLQTSLT